MSETAPQTGATDLLQYAAGTTTGASRSVNEDAFGAFSERAVFVVVDGCGGRGSAESAAQLTVAQFADLRRPDVPAPLELSEGDSLARAVLRANAEVLHHGLARADRRGQGAALCAVRVSPGTLSVAHVGDCRVGRLREGQLVWLTEDHTLAVELRRSGAPAAEIARAEETHANVITRAVGVGEHLVVDVSYHPTAPGDLYLLCSDGLTGQVDPGALRSLLLGDPSRGLADRCTALLAASEAAGGSDNATAVLLRLR